MNGHTDCRTDGWTDRQTDRQTDTRVTECSHHANARVHLGFHKLMWPNAVNIHVECPYNTAWIEKMLPKRETTHCLINTKHIVTETDRSDDTDSCLYSTVRWQTQLAVAHWRSEDFVKETQVKRMSNVRQTDSQ